MPLPGSSLTDSPRLAARPGSSSGNRGNVPWRSITIGPIRGGASWAAAGAVAVHSTHTTSTASRISRVYCIFAVQFAMPNRRLRHNMMRLMCAAIMIGAFIVDPAGQQRPRARDLGIRPGIYDPGPLNAITDVDPVRVGHTTIVEGDGVRTGVTAILAHGGNLFQDKVAGAVFVGNAFGKLAGSTQVHELGTVETPIVLTNTLSVGIAMDAVVRYTLAQAGNEQVRSVNPLVGETNDGGLNDIRGLHVTREHVLQAISSAKGGPVSEGAVGAGTGTICYGWKGGIGTSSRTLTLRESQNDRGRDYTVGVLAQTNFGGNLT